MSTAPQVPTVEVVAQALGREVEDVRRAYDAEAADQANRCRVDPYAAPLADALHRRVARNIAMRALVLGVQVNGETTTRISSLDGEVRRLEGPYRRLVAG